MYWRILQAQEMLTMFLLKVTTHLDQLQHDHHDIECSRHQSFSRPDHLDYNFPMSRRTLMTQEFKKVTGT